ncbi:MAG: hypothetical protein QOD11_3338 [Bradyrhizobium sp.]|jgi:hypothetical protein|nr:hypothetical protein [Bradyrhizobium sp.]
MATDLAMQHSSWMMALLSGFILPLMLASAALAMFWLNGKR